MDPGGAPGRDAATAAGRRDRAILVLFYNTGPRAGEMCALNREDLTPPAEGWSALQVAGKGRGLHRLPINRPAAHALLARPNLRAAQEPLGHAWVTTTQRHTHLAAEDLQGRMAQLPANPAV